MALPLAMPGYVMAYSLLGLSGYGSCANGSASRCRPSTAFGCRSRAVALYSRLSVPEPASGISGNGLCAEGIDATPRAGQSEVFRRMILALLWPALVASGLIVGLYVVGDFP